MSCTHKRSPPVLDKVLIVRVYGDFDGNTQGVAYLFLMTWGASYPCKNLRPGFTKQSVWLIGVLVRIYADRNHTIASDL